jgi:UDP-N-acetylmuramyl pentapeptide phosphotransferase/UDP-N-acetylglucosamine-1-phosphate transferase
MNSPLKFTLLAAALSFFVCAALLLLLLRSGLAERVLDRPNARSLHVRPIPRVGGLAILLAIFVSAASLGNLDTRLILLLPLVAVSLVDDVRGLSIAPRIATHLAVAAVAVMGFWPQLGDAPWWLWLAGGAAIVWSTNLYNFMDGSDGLAGGMTVFGFSFLALAAFQGGDTGLAAYCLSLAAAALAFLFFNFHPASIFMGDSGAAPIGFAAALAGLEGGIKGIWPFWYPVLVFSPFVLDASATLLRRLLRGERFWQAHREHYYQRLIRLGWGHRRTALAYYALMLAAGLAAYSARPLAMPWPLLVLLAALGLAARLMFAVDRAWSARLKNSNEV